MESDTFERLEQPTDTAPVRLFFSINPPPDVIHHLSAIQSQVRTAAIWLFIGIFEKNPSERERAFLSAHYHRSFSSPAAKVCGANAHPVGKGLVPRICLAG
jgi:hypothetical protein